MRISIDAIPLLVPSAGVKSYLFYWIRHLMGLAAGPTVSLFPWLRPGDVLDHRGSPLGRLPTAARIAFLHLANLPGLHLLDRLVSADIFHSVKVLNPPRGCRLTATLHDLTCWLTPQFHRPENITAEKRFAGRIWRRADGLIAVSEATRADAVRVLGLNPERIRVIHHGVPEAFFAAGKAEAAAAAARYALPPRYVLFVGTIEPRKNLDRALDAYLALPSDVRREFAFVVAGPLGWAPPATAARLLEAPPSGVRYLGYVAEADLPGLTAGASLLFYPSLYEGFGFPVAQAMAAGVPILTSNLSALPEIAGDAALLADPLSPAELASHLERMLLSPSLRERLAGAARLRAQRFHWDRCARESFDFFQSLE